MSVSVSTFQLRLLVVAIVVGTGGQLVEVSNAHGRAASDASIAEPSASASLPRRRPEELGSRFQNSAHVVPHRNLLARRSIAPARDPLLAVLAKPRPASAPFVSITEDEEASRSSSVNPTGVRAPLSAPHLVPEAEAALGATVAKRGNPDASLANIVILADTYDDTRMSPMWPGSPPSPASFVASELAILFGACSCVALSIYGLVATKLRRRERRACGACNNLVVHPGNLT
jgi:hypothetical protein